MRKREIVFPNVEVVDKEPSWEKPEVLIGKNTTLFYLSKINRLLQKYGKVTVKGKSKFTIYKILFLLVYLRWSAKPESLKLWIEPSQNPYLNEKANPLRSILCCELKLVRAH